MKAKKIKQPKLSRRQVVCADLAARIDTIRSDVLSVIEDAQAEGDLDGLVEGLDEIDAGLGNAIEGLEDEA